MWPSTLLTWADRTGCSGLFDFLLHFCDSSGLIMGTGSWLQRSSELWFLPFSKVYQVCSGMWLHNVAYTGVQSLIAYMSGPKPQRRTTSPCDLYSASIWVSRPGMMKDSATGSKLGPQPLVTGVFWGPLSWASHLFIADALFQLIPRPLDEPDTA